MPLSRNCRLSLISAFVPPEKLLRHGGDILSSFPQRDDPYGPHSQQVQQFPVESSRLNHRLQIPRRRRDDTDSAHPLLVASDPGKAGGLKVSRSRVWTFGTRSSTWSRTSVPVSAISRYPRLHPPAYAALPGTWPKRADSCASSRAVGVGSLDTFGGEEQFKERNGRQFALLLEIISRAIKTLSVPASPLITTFASVEANSSTSLFKSLAHFVTPGRRFSFIGSRMGKEAARNPFHRLDPLSLPLRLGFGNTSFQDMHQPGIELGKSPAKGRILSLVYFGGH